MNDVGIAANTAGETFPEQDERYLWRRAEVCFCLHFSETDYGALERRFGERVENALANPEKKISNTSKERFRGLFGIFQKEKNHSAKVFRSDEQNAEEIADEIPKLL